VNRAKTKFLNEPETTIFFCDVIKQKHQHYDGCFKNLQVIFWVSIQFTRLVRKYC